MPPLCLPELTAQIYPHLGIDDLRSAVEKIEPATTEPEPLRPARGRTRRSMSARAAKTAYTPGYP
jgi:hypothetical protein